MGNQVTARRRRLWTAACRSPKQCLTDLGPQPADIDLEAGAVQRPVSHPMPPAEHPIGQVEQPLPNGRPVALPINHRLKVPTQVRPAELAAAKPVIRLPAIRRDHLSVTRTEQGPGDFAATGGRNMEDRY